VHSFALDFFLEGGGGGLARLTPKTVGRVTARLSRRGKPRCNHVRVFFAPPVCTLRVGVNVLDTRTRAIKADDLMVKDSLTMEKAVENRS
jgi:hypothetical protein